jgi:hypothetical protein
MEHRNFFTWPAWLAVLLCTSAVNATFWTVTSYFQISLSTSQYGYGTYTDAYTYTTTQTIRSGVTPAANPVSTSSYVYTYEDLTVIYLYVPPGSVPESDIVTTTTRDTSEKPYTVYVEPIVYTAPTSCPKAFTVATMTQVNIPSEVADRVTPTAYSTSVGAYYSYTYVTAYLSPSAVPLDQEPATSDFVYSYYIASCRNPTATGAAYYGPSHGGGSGSSSSSSDIEVCSLLTGCTTIRTWVIVIASVLPSLFVLGFVESYLWFRQLMLGKTAMRVGTICWILLSLWVLCFTRQVPARGLEDQAALKIQWDAMSAGTRWKLWWRWGFRNAYPVDLLGLDPRDRLPAARVNPQMQQYHENAPAELTAAPPPYGPTDSSANKSVQVGHTVDRVD